MGLDMYLKSAKKNPDFTLQQMIEMSEGIWDCKDKGFIENHKNIINEIMYDWYKEPRYSFFKEQIYWRKANAIHKWFVDNVQNGNDDCEYYEVTKDNIEELCNLCKEVLEKSYTVDGKVNNGFTIKNGKMKVNTIDGKIIINPEIAESLLPTQSGFFFGGTGYDEFYIEDLTYTYEKLYDLLKNFDFENNYLVYRSSW